MEPKLIFLGTGGDSLVVGKQMRTSGGLIIQTDNNQFHIDPGPGSLTCARCYGVNPRNSMAIVATNNLVNNCNDINAAIDAMTHGGLDRKGVFIGNKSVIHGDDNNYPFLTRHHRKCVEKIITMEPGNRVGINNIEIKSFETREGIDNNGIILRFLTPYFSLGYISNTAYYNGLIEKFKGVDLLIMKVVSPKDFKEEGSLSSEDAMKIISNVKPKLAILTGFGVKMVQGDPLEEARAIQRATGVQTIAAKDGMVINPLSYSVNLRQKTLNFF